MVQNQNTQQPLQEMTLNTWRWNRVLSEKHAEDVNREIMRRQFAH